MYIFALLTILGIYGLQLGDIALSVTVFSAVVGVVLAPILGGLISGVFLLADQPYEIGDMIELADTGQRGFVEDITLRHTKVFTLDNTFPSSRGGESASGSATTRRLKRDARRGSLELTSATRRTSRTSAGQGDTSSPAGRPASVRPGPRLADGVYQQFRRPRRVADIAVLGDRTVQAACCPLERPDDRPRGGSKRNVEIAERDALREFDDPARRKRLTHRRIGRA